MWVVTDDVGWFQGLFAIVVLVYVDLVCLCGVVLFLACVCCDRRFFVCVCDLVVWFNDGYC